MCLPGGVKWQRRFRTFLVLCAFAYWVLRGICAYSCSLVGVATLLGWDLAYNIPETLNAIEGLQAYVNALVQHDLALGNGTTFVEAALDLHFENSACAMQAQMDLQ
jgi:hypothetical protein